MNMSQPNSERLKSSRNAMCVLAVLTSFLGPHLQAAPDCADLAASFTPLETTGVAGTDLTYTLRVQNQGPEAVSGIEVRLNLPADFINLQYTPATGSYNPGLGRWTVNLAVGQEAQMTILGDISPSATGTFRSFVEVDVPFGQIDPNFANNRADARAVPLVSVVDLSVIKTNRRNGITRGERVAYDVEVENLGPSTAFGFDLTDTFPAELSNPSFSPSVGNYDPTTERWTQIQLGPNTRATLAVGFDVSTSAEDFIENRVLVRYTQGTDPNPDNDRSSDIDPVCGDGKIRGAETCDDGNVLNGDGCFNFCQIEPGFVCSGEPSVCLPTCGNGLIDSGEACDDNNITEGDGCSAACVVEPGYVCNGEPSVCVASTCGNGRIDGNEACDDGNGTNGDGCSSVCVVEPGFVCRDEPSVCVASCGNGRIDAGEACDDGDIIDGDGCSPICAIEPGFVCTGEPSVCRASCGNGRIDANETCDDGNINSEDGCSVVCQVEPGYVCNGEPSVCNASCGDGRLDLGETCDDDNLVPGDGCSAVCQTEPGYVCLGEPSVCRATCGNGQIDEGENCDDGNIASGDGCSPVCQNEPGYVCVDEPSVCSFTCGNSRLDPGEACDDGNLRSEDGCSAICQVDPGYTCEGEPSQCRPNGGDQDGDGFRDNVFAQGGGGCQNAASSSNPLVVLSLALGWFAFSIRRNRKRRE
jgi:uncharacterized repeat protein (TIGR01451 family)